MVRDGQSQMAKLKRASCCVYDVSGDGSCIPPPCGEGRPEAGVGVATGTASVVATPTRLAQIKNLGQPPMRERSSSQTPQGGGIARGHRLFSYAIALPLAGMARNFASHFG